MSNMNGKRQRKASNTEELIRFLLICIFLVLHSTEAQFLRRRVDICPENQDERTLILEVVLEDDPASLTPTDLELLEEAALVSLQELETEYECLKILSVSFDPAATHRSLSTSGEMHRRLVLFQLGHLIVLYQCNQCFNGPILNNDGSRRSLQEQKHMSRKDFTALFESNILSITKLQGKVSGILELNEVETKKCDAPQQGNANLRIQVAGGLLSDSEIKQIENAALEGYNAMNRPNTEYCDKHFRKITEVIYTASNPQKDAVDMYFTVHYEYRNGEVTQLFDTVDAPPRDAHIDALVNSQSNSLECACDVFASNNRGPMEEEFSAALNIFLNNNDSAISVLL